MGRRKPIKRIQHKPKVLNIKKDFRLYLANLMSTSEYPEFNMFSSIASGLIIEEDPSINTFCITVKNRVYIMKYSPTMVEELDVFGAGIVLAHEMGHGLLKHVPRMIRYENMFKEDKDMLLKFRAVVHVAADFSLNSMLIDVWKLFTLEDLKTRVGKPVEGEVEFNGKPMSTYAGIHPSDAGLPVAMSMDFYIAELAKKIQNNKQSPILSNPGSEKSEDKESKKALSSPGDFKSTVEAIKGMSPDQLEELLKATGTGKKGLLEELEEAGELEGYSIDELTADLEEEAKDLIKKASKISKSRGIGSNDCLTKWCEKQLQEPTLNWKDLLRRLVSTSKPARVSRSMRRARLRTALIPGAMPFPGRVKVPEFNIVAILDTSGSVDDYMIKELNAELSSIYSQAGTSITLVQCDTKIKSVEPYKGSLEHVRGRGGTDFNPPFRWLATGEGHSAVPPTNIDLVLYATDGECPLPDMKNRVIPDSKVLWLISSEGKVPDERSWSGKRPDKVYGTCGFGNYIHVQKG